MVDTRPLVRPGPRAGPLERAGGPGYLVVVVAAGQHHPRDLHSAQPTPAAPARTHQHFYMQPPYRMQ